MIILPVRTAIGTSENHRKLIVLLRSKPSNISPYAPGIGSKRKGQRTRFDDDIMVSGFHNAIYNIQIKLTKLKYLCQVYIIL
jgi:hypothetical protein